MNGVQELDLVRQERAVLLHLPLRAVLQVAAGGAGRGGQDRWRGLGHHLSQDHHAHQWPGRRHGGDPHLPAHLEPVPVAADRDHHAGHAGDPDRHQDADRH